MLPSLRGDFQQFGNIFLAGKVISLVERGGAHTSNYHVRHVNVHGATSEVAFAVGDVGVAALEESVEFLVGNVQHGLGIDLFETEAVEGYALALFLEFRQVSDEPLDLRLDLVGLVFEQDVATAQVLVAEHEDLVALDELDVVLGKDASDHVDDHVVAQFVDDGQVVLVGGVREGHANSMDEFFLDVLQEIGLVAP